MGWRTSSGRIVWRGDCIPRQLLKQNSVGLTELLGWSESTAGHAFPLPGQEVVLRRPALRPPGTPCPHSAGGTAPEDRVSSRGSENRPGVGGCCGHFPFRSFKKTNTCKRRKVLFVHFQPQTRRKQSRGSLRSGQRRRPQHGPPQLPLRLPGKFPGSGACAWRGGGCCPSCLLAA